MCTVHVCYIEEEEPKHTHARLCFACIPRAAASAPPAFVCTLSRRHVGGVFVEGETPRQIVVCTPEREPRQIRRCSVAAFFANSSFCGRTDGLGPAYMSVAFHYINACFCFATKQRIGMDNIRPLPIHPGPAMYHASVLVHVKGAY